MKIFNYIIIFRHVVERHLSDKHAEKRPFVKVIREPDVTEPVPAVQDATDQADQEEGPDRDGNHWKCNVCDYKCIYKNEMISHASIEHDERAQFKCTECPYKTGGKINVEQHFVSRHPNEQEIKYDMVYQKIKGGLKRQAINDSNEQYSNDEPFDTTPLWRRDMPRVRHIRGILLEDEDAGRSSESVGKGTKRKSEGGGTTGDSVTPSKSARLKASSKTSNNDASLTIGKSINDDKGRVSTTVGILKKDGGDGDNQRISKTRAAIDKQRIFDKSMENDKDKDGNEASVNDRNVSEEFNELSDSEMGQFGPYGKPKGVMYVCTLCNFFETRYKHDLRDHLYRELKYKR